MKKIEDLVIVVQARLNSERVPRKMLRNFADTTLLDICLQKLKKSKIIPISNIYLVAYENELIECARRNDINVFRRSEASANSEGEDLRVLYEWWDKLPFKYGILVNACVPFLSIETIDNFVEEYLHSTDDGMFGVVAKKNYFWNKKGKLISNDWTNEQEGMNTKYADPVLEAAHCLYASDLSLVGENKWMGDLTKEGDVVLYEIEHEFEVLDIDYEWQFRMCESLYSKLGELGEK